MWGIFDLGDHQPIYGRFEFPSIQQVIADTNVCDGDNLNLSVSTDLTDYTIEWDKDDDLLEGTEQLTYIKNDVTSSDWGTYRCELIYTYEADDEINGSNPHPNYGSYVDQGVYEGRLIEQFNVGPIPEECGFVTGVEEGLETDIKIFPNPVVDWLQIALPQNLSFEVVVFNAIGEQIYQSNHHELANINMVDWSPGIYHVDISLGQESIHSQPFLKL